MTKVPLATSGRRVRVTYDGNDDVFDLHYTEDRHWLFLFVANGSASYSRFVGESNTALDELREMIGQGVDLPVEHPAHAGDAYQPGDEMIFYSFAPRIGEEDSGWWCFVQPTPAPAEFPPPLQGWSLRRKRFRDWACRKVGDPTWVLIWFDWRSWAFVGAVVAVLIVVVYIVVKLST